MVPFGPLTSAVSRAVSQPGESRPPIVMAPVLRKLRREWRVCLFMRVFMRVFMGGPFLKG